MFVYSKTRQLNLQLIAQLTIRDNCNFNAVASGDYVATFQT